MAHQHFPDEVNVSEVPSIIIIITIAFKGAIRDLASACNSYSCPVSRGYACALVTVVRALAHYFHVFFFRPAKVVFYTHEINPFPTFMIRIKFMLFVVYCY